MTLAALVALVAALWTSSASASFSPSGKAPWRDVAVQLLAINDFHGHLQPNTPGTIRISPTTVVPAGGVEYLATHIKALRTANTNTLTVGAGDLIGASPLISGLFHDEPAIEAMNAIGLDVSGVGNHEFDEGVSELLRMQYGGCHPVDGCQEGDPFGGALFRYLAANVYYEGTDDTILPSYEVHSVDGVKIAFIGLTLEGTPLIVTPTGVAGLEFRPEVETVNALVAKLQREQAIRAFVVLLHEGGGQNAPFTKGFEDVNGCDNLTGAITDIVWGLHKDVDVVVSAHTHRPYICDIAAKLVTSASSFGRLVTDIDLVIDRGTRDVQFKKARNVVVTQDVPKDPALTAIVNKYQTLSAPLANMVVGSITADMIAGRDGGDNAAGESTMGDVIADAQLAATAPTDFGGAEIAFMNPGGIRASLRYANQYGTEAPGEVTYGELFSVQPFGNSLVVKDCTGAQIYALLEQQFDNPLAGQRRILQVSEGFAYSYDSTGGAGSRVTPGSVTLNGTAIDPLATYRVTMNSFLAPGGDGFSVFTQCTNDLGGEVDLDALVRYFEENSPVPPGPQDRITRLG
jgi:5'-nucleotidase